MINTTLWPGQDWKIVQDNDVRVIAQVSIYSLLALPDGAQVGAVQAWRAAPLLAIKFANGDIVAYDHDGDDTYYYSCIDNHGDELIQWSTFQAASMEVTNG